MLKPLIAATLLAATACAQAANPITNRIFTADPAGGVHLGSRRRWAPPRAITSR